MNLTTTATTRPGFSMRAVLLEMAADAQRDLDEAREVFDTLATGTLTTTDGKPISTATGDWLRDEVANLIGHLARTQARLDAANWGLRMLETATACQPPPAA